MRLVKHKDTNMSCDYSSYDKDVMYRTAKSVNVSRLQELIDFAKLSGFKKLGIANCVAVTPYAQKLIELLRAAGFEVVALGCRDSGLDAHDINPELSGPSCDPLSQAEFLNKEKTDFNILVGLCLGHELVFQKHSQAPYTTFLVKDLATNNKTIENLE